MNTTSPIVGTLFVITSAILFGIQPIFGTQLQMAGVDPIALNAVRYSVPALLLILLLFIRPIRGVRKRDAICHGWLGLGFASAGIGHYEAGFKIGFSLAVILVFLFPVIVTLYSIFVLRLKTSRLQVIAMITALLGLLLALDIKTDIQNYTGIAWALLAAVSTASLLIYRSHYAPDIDDRISLTVCMIAASLAIGIVILSKGAAFPATINAWCWNILLAIICGLLPIGLLMAGSRKIGALDASTLSVLEPIVAIAVSILILDDSASINTLLGGTLVIVSAVILTRSRIKKADLSSVVKLT